MIKLIPYIIITLVVISCEHPENKIYQRNQGSSHQFKNSSETPNLNSDEIDYTTYSDKNRLPFETENGVKYVWIEVNGVRLRFIFDTGASSISISPVEATLLYKQGTLKDSDIIGSEFFQDATGHISEGTKVNLRSVKIGSETLTNVSATIVNNYDAPLLLGQSVLERFGSIEIDNNNNEIVFK